MTVPHVANAATVTGATGFAAWRGGITWYRTTLTAPRTGSYALRFESVHHIATVWLDGRPIATHTGAYLPFEVHLRLRGGIEHRLVVRADYRYPTRQKRTGWHRTWFNYGGINREVTLRPLARQRARGAGACARALYRGTAIVDVAAASSNRDSRASRDLQARGSLTRAGRVIAFRFPRVHLGPGETRRVTHPRRRPGARALAARLAVALRAAPRHARRRRAGPTMSACGEITRDGARAAAQRPAPAAARRVDPRGRRRATATASADATWTPSSPS